MIPEFMRPRGRKQACGRPPGPPVYSPQGSGPRTESFPFGPRLSKIPCFRPGEPATRARLFHLRVLSLGLLQDRDLRVGFFPKSKEILVGAAAFGSVPYESIRAPQSQMSQRIVRRNGADAPMIQNLLELDCRCGP